ncbi:unnamed protein product [Gulo gulo]|uniref:Uncharacterized protein n=1 Tax=Gulo gulo TaxID=48420 RepID=A0A9X9Q6W3_GULGU|nr:unnamed protein product [Gulo gulo]
MSPQLSLVSVKFLKTMENCGYCQSVCVCVCVCAHYSKFVVVWLYVCLLSQNLTAYVCMGRWF